MDHENDGVYLWYYCLISFGTILDSYGCRITCVVTAGCMPTNNTCLERNTVTENRDTHPIAMISYMPAMCKGCHGCNITPDDTVGNDLLSP